ncbi:uncharacterized protein E0L32_005177 [Thyridium curvatum]|uniref:Uncharacterized protein n=1 Tax=Thyridium curvatum TaxID=1093900 RepID=A0A507AXV2_9PEZI|nr:uncharacterized protein E0L32_005177 [Thyridium curvatum]TPX14782.1 hypothetical protein E0L32_005177 [Thyridium curvatum]
MASSLFHIIVNILALHAIVANAGQVFPRACTRTVNAKSGDSCATLSRAAGITVAQFINYNPSVTSCGGLVPGKAYCVASDGSEASSPPAQTSPSLSITKDGQCGKGVTCAGSTYGDCCSEHGWCGDSEDHCGPGQGDRHDPDHDEDGKGDCHDANKDGQDDRHALAVHLADSGNRDGDGDVDEHAAQERRDDTDQPDYQDLNDQRGQDDHDGGDQHPVPDDPDNLDRDLDIDPDRTSVPNMGPSSQQYGRDIPVTDSGRADQDIATTQMTLMTDINNHDVGKEFYKVKQGDYCDKIVEMYGTFNIVDL